MNKLKTLTILILILLTIPKTGLTEIKQFDQDCQTMINDSIDSCIEEKGEDRCAGKYTFDLATVPFAWSKLGKVGKVGSVADKMGDVAFVFC